MKILITLLLLAASMFAADTTRTINQDCSKVWKASVQAVTGKSFHPTVLDKDSGVGTFAYDGGVIPVPIVAVTIVKGKVISNYDERKAGLDKFVAHPDDIKLSFWDFIRIDSLSLTLNGEATCTAKIKVVYSVRPRSNVNWTVVESNGTMESTILDSIEAATKP